MTLQKEEDKCHLALGVSTTLGGNGAIEEPMLIFEVEILVCVLANG